MDRHLQTVRGFRPHGSLHVSTHMGDITVEKVVGHPSIDISSIGGSIELLMESAAFSGESLFLCHSSCHYLTQRLAGKTP